SWKFSSWSRERISFNLETSLVNR
ncbi:hypothetical protein D047_2679B, partial [Vibrio parahaemolyticus VPTS-2010_2]